MKSHSLWCFLLGVAWLSSVLSGCPPSPPQPAIGVSASTHSFGTSTSTWNFQVWNAGEASSTLQWTASANQAWIGLAPASGSSTGTGDTTDVTVTVNRALLGKTDYTGTITLSAEGAANKNIDVSVSREQDPVEPSADFSGTPLTGLAPLTVAFTDASSPGSESITSRAWDFGDGESSIAANPEHTYDMPGAYTVSLTVTTPVGSDTETKTNYITASEVSTPPTAAFSATPVNGEAPADIQFTDQSVAGSAAITGWLWDFGDGSEGAERSQQHPLHTYQAAGTYTVSLTVSSASGSDTATQNDYIQVSAYVAPPEVDVEMVSVAAGSFEMGRSEDEWWGREDELPRHTVTLDAYEIGVREVTAGDFAAMLNWALAQGDLIGEDNEPYHQFDNICVADANHYSGRRKIFQMEYSTQESDRCPLEYAGGQFIVKERDGLDLINHPILQVTWCGAMMYCNWLSDIAGLPRCYDAQWHLVDPLPEGYRLPTEAEWERAAGWGGKHWHYGFQSDDIDNTLCNYGNFNPLELTKPPYTVPVGYFTAVSPVGCVDMSGNVLEWCYDGYEAYPETPQVNPTGRVAEDVNTTSRVYRGGDWYNGADASRTAARFANSTTSWGSGLGFRLARTP